MNLRRRSEIVLVTIMLAGCVTPRSDLALNLKPAWIGLLFSDQAAAASYVNKNDREWLTAAAYYIYKRHDRFTSTDTLNQFLASQFDGRFRLIPPFPNVISPGVFHFTLRNGEGLAVTVTPTELSLVSSDRELTNALLKDDYQHMPPSQERRQEEDMGFTHALISVFGSHF